MKFWAIRIHGTNLYMPDLGTRRYGWSHTEFEPNGGYFGPRRFWKPRSAQYAAAAWKRGIHVTTNRKMCFANGRAYGATGMRIEPVPDRANADLEVIEMLVLPSEHPLLTWTISDDTTPMDNSR